MPTAAIICTTKVLGTPELCLCLPEELSQISWQYLYLQCTANGCHALNLLQQRIRVRGTADLEVFLQRFNSKGLKSLLRGQVVQHAAGLKTVLSTGPAGSYLPLTSDEFLALDSHLFLAEKRHGLQSQDHACQPQVRDN